MCGERSHSRHLKTSFWNWESFGFESCIYVHIYAPCDYLPGFPSHGSFESNKVLLTSYFSLFASYLSLIITNADEMIA